MGSDMFMAAQFERNDPTYRTKVHHEEQNLRVMLMKKAVMLERQRVRRRLKKLFATNKISAATLSMLIDALDARHK